MVPSAPDIASAEDAIVFGGDVRLVGIVTTPAETRAAAGDRTGVILLNAGVECDRLFRLQVRVAKSDKARCSKRRKECAKPLI